MSYIGGISSNSNDYLEILNKSANGSSDSKTNDVLSAGTTDVPSSDASGLNTDSLSFSDGDGDGICSINDLNKRLNELYAKQQENDKNGITDKDLNREISDTKKVIKDFQNWSKQLGLDPSGEFLNLSSEASSLIQRLSQNYSGQSGFIVDESV